MEKEMDDMAARMRSTDRIVRVLTGWSLLALGAHWIFGV